jgi:hypothetical protein
MVARAPKQCYSPETTLRCDARTVLTFPGMLMNRRCIIWVTLGWVAPILLGPRMLGAESPILTGRSHH